MQLSKNVINALKVIEHEYNTQKNSCDSYMFLDAVKEQLQDMRQRKIDGVEIPAVPVLKEDTRVQDYTLALIRDVSGVHVDSLLDIVNLSVSEIVKKIDFDELDWIELIMDLEEYFNIEVPLHFEDYNTTLRSLIDYIKNAI